MCKSCCILVQPGSVFREHDYKKAPDLPSEVEERQVICRLLQAMDIDILDYSITKEQGFDDPSLILTHGKADGNTFLFLSMKNPQASESCLP